jgi:hypothetical protein
MPHPWAMGKKIWTKMTKKDCKILFLYYEILKSMFTFDYCTNEFISNLTAF